MKYLSGGYQTTINSTITELFPALAFNNGRKLNNADQMYDYILDLTKKKQLNTSKSGKSFVNKGDMDAGYDFVKDTSKIRPSMLQEKLSNAVGIQKYLYELSKGNPIQKVVWGYRAKPKGVPDNHAGDIFVFFKKGKVLGISLKAGSAKSAEPKMNSYVRTTIKKDMWVKSDRTSEIKLKRTLWNKCYSKVPGMPRSLNADNWIDVSSKAQKPKPEVQANVLKLFLSNPKKFDALYNIQNQVCREHMCNMINKDLEATKQWIKEEFRLQTPGSTNDVPLILVKAVGNSASEQGDKLAKIFPKIDKVKAYLNPSSVQEWFIDVHSGKEKLTLLMTIRSDSEYREAKQKGKLGAYMGLKLLYRGYK